MVVTLNEVEQKLAAYIAKRRHNSNRAGGVRDQKVGPQDAHTTDLLGIGGEIAFCKLFNLYPDLSVEPRSGSVDCVWRGLRVDVKTTAVANGRLLAVPTKRHDEADLYAMMVARWPEFEFAGYATAEELLDKSRLTDLGHGDTFAMGQSELSSEGIRWGFQ